MTLVEEEGFEFRVKLTRGEVKMEWHQSECRIIDALKAGDVVRWRVIFADI